MYSSECWQNFARARQTTLFELTGQRLKWLVKGLCAARPPFHQLRNLENLQRLKPINPRKILSLPIICEAREAHAFFAFFLADIVTLMNDKQVLPIRPTREKVAAIGPRGIILTVFGQRFRIESNIRITELPPRKPGQLIPMCPSKQGTTRSVTAHVSKPLSRVLREPDTRQVTRRECWSASDPVGDMRLKFWVLAQPTWDVNTYYRELFLAAHIGAF